MKFILILIASFLHFSLLKAQELSPFYPALNLSPQNLTKLNVHSYGNLLGKNFHQDIYALTSLNKRQWINLMGVSILTTGIIFADGPIDKYAKTIRIHNRFINNSSPIITRFGADYAFYTVGAVGLLGLVFRNNRAETTALLASQAIITSGVWARFGKFIAGRERPTPYITRSFESGGFWHGPGHNFDFDEKKLPAYKYDAFPSGHTATAFSIATVFAKMYSDEGFVPILSYSAATAVGLSRLTQHTHWMSDVIIGAALGYLCGAQVVHNYDKMGHHKIESLNLNNLSISINKLNGAYMPDFSYCF